MSTSADRPRPGSRPRPEPAEAAIAVETYVVERRGQWAVQIAVIFPSGAVHRSISTYRSRREVDIAASWIKRDAERDIEGPIHG